VSQLIENQYIEQKLL